MLNNEKSVEALRKIFLRIYARCQRYEANANRVAYGYRSEMGALRTALKALGEPAYDLPDLPPRPRNPVGDEPSFYQWHDPAECATLPKETVPCVTTSTTRL